MYAKSSMTKIKFSHLDSSNQYPLHLTYMSEDNAVSVLPKTM